MHLPTQHFARFFRAGLNFKKYCRAGNDRQPLETIDPKRLMAALSKGYPNHLMGSATESRIVNNPLYQYSYGEELLRFRQIERLGIAVIAATTGLTFYFAGSLWGLLPLMWLLYRVQRFSTINQGISNSVSRISLLDANSLRIQKENGKVLEGGLSSYVFLPIYEIQEDPSQQSILEGLMVMSVQNTSHRAILLLKGEFLITNIEIMRKIITREALFGLDVQIVGEPQRQSRSGEGTNKNEDSTQGKPPIAKQ